MAISLGVSSRRDEKRVTARKLKPSAFLLTEKIISVSPSNTLSLQAG